MNAAAFLGHYQPQLYYFLISTSNFTKFLKNDYFAIRLALKGQALEFTKTSVQHTYLRD